LLTIDTMYALARRTARRLPKYPACDEDDLVQCAVLGMTHAAVADEKLALVIARRRMIDEIRRHRGRPRTAETPAPQALEPLHLFEPVVGEQGRCLADLLSDGGDRAARLVDRLDATRELALLLRACGRRGRQVLWWHVAEGRSIVEIAARYRISQSRVSQIMAEARARARSAHDACEDSGPIATVPPRRSRRPDAAWFEATTAEKRAFGEFRRLQRAGLRRPQALAALPESLRLLVAEYQRKCQRRVRARATGNAIAKQPPRSQLQYLHEDEVAITPEERSAAGALWSMRSRIADSQEAFSRLTDRERGLVESYNAKMRIRARIRARRALNTQQAIRSA
jgi:RNA polymerase sigma factor (sigma-70 family)